MTDAPLHLDPVDRMPRLSDVVSERLLAAIHDAGLQPGDSLPSERELGDRFGVSRTVVREAIRHLAARGVLHIRSGFTASVAPVDGSNVGIALAVFLGRTGLPDPRKIHEVRTLIETQTTYLAARRATPEQLAEIRSTQDRLSRAAGNPGEAVDADVAFHRAIARASGNDLFVVLVDSLSDIMIRIRQATAWRPGRLQVGLEHHGRILAALERGAPEASVQAMRAHLAESLDALVQALEEQPGHAVERPTPGERTVAAPAGLTRLMTLPSTPASFPRPNGRTTL